MPYKPGQKIGYLGGGQLARFLSQSAQRMGLEAHVFSSNVDDPAAQVVRHWQQGEISDTKKLSDFLNQTSVTTFESEFIDIDLLKKGMNKKNNVYPRPDIMGLLQDRKLQKNLLDENSIATSDWRDVPDQNSLSEYVKEFSYPFVLKKRFMGYDGYGTFIIKNKTELDQFLKQNWKNDLYIVEQFVPFKKECAVIVARSSNGTLTHLPFVESHQKDARCDWVKGPISLKKEKKIIKQFFKLLEKLDYVGVMGIEFFLFQKELIVNEIAPRVHNTAHYSIDTEGLSQFDLHNMALLGLDLPPPQKMKQAFAMVNLIGTGQELMLSNQTGLHWYGKKENKKGRKMGHLTVTASTPEQALKKALKIRGEMGL